MAENNQLAGAHRTADIWSATLSGIPAFRGRGRMTDAFARIALIAGNGWGTCSPAAGATLRVNLADRIERQMWGGCYEPHVRRALRALVTPGDVFIDIGAHIGYHAVCAAIAVGPRGRLFAFEADPRNFARLSEHLAPFPWATPVAKAVSAETGTMVFERSSEPGESGWGTLTNVRDLAKGEHIRVDAISLDDWISANPAGSIAAMKIDAEGSEVHILRGAQNFLRQARPAIVIEANDVVLRQAGTSALELAQMLRAADYEIYELDSATLSLLSAEASPRTDEVIALPKERARATVDLLQRSGFPLKGPKSAAEKTR